MIDRVRHRFDLRPLRLAGDSAYGAVRLLKWLVESKLRRMFRCGTSRRVTTAPLAELTSSSTGSAMSMSAQAAQNHRDNRSGPHRLLQSQKERLFGLLVESKV
jgi:hypothetical protein